MCEALKELFADDLRESREQGIIEGRIEGRNAGRIEVGTPEELRVESKAELNSL